MANHLHLPVVTKDDIPVLFLSNVRDRNDMYTHHKDVSRVRITTDSLQPKNEPRLQMDDLHDTLYIVGCSSTSRDA